MARSVHREEVAGRPPLRAAPFLLEGSPDHGVLLVHGLGGGPHEVQRLAEDLHARLGVTARAFRLPGHDGPGPAMPPSTWPEWAEALEREHAALASRFARVDLVGFSTGCPLVLNLAADGLAGAGRIVLLAPFVRIYRPPLLPWSPERLMRALPFVHAVPRRAPPLRDRAVRAEVSRCAPLRTFNVDAVRSALELIGRVMPRLGDVRARALVVQGEDDTVVDPRGAHEVRAGLGGERRLVWIEGSDHLLTLDAQAPRVLGEVRAFLAEP